VSYALRVRTVPRQLAVEKTLFGVEANHHECDRDDRYQRRGVRFQPQTQTHEDQRGRGVKRVANDRVDAGVRDRMFSLMLQANHACREGIGAKRHALDDPAEDE